MNIRQIMQQAPVIPVIVLDAPESAVPMAQALLDGGLRVLEVTLRTDAALASIAAIKQHVPKAIVGAGTVNTVTQMEQCAAINVDFVVSPGFYQPLVDAARAQQLAYLPAAATAGEVLTAVNAGLDSLKFFPAAAAGGLPFLKAMSGPYAQVQFCPTGGIGANNYKDYLALENVTCVGGSWVAPAKLIAASEWQQIQQLAAQVSAAAD